MLRKLATVLIVFGLSGSLWARTKSGHMPQRSVMDINLLDGNEFNMYISNYGKFGQSPQGNAGAWWPSNRRLETYIFGAGPWIGATTIKDTQIIYDTTVVDTDSIIVDTVTVVNFDTVVTFFYNPNSGQSEGVPAHIADPNDLYNYNAALGDPYDRVHIYGKTTEQGYEWPLKTQSGQDSVVSNMDSYEAFMDIDSAYQESGSKPLGLYVVEQTYQWAVPGLDNILFNIYEIKNVSGDTLYNVYAGITYDDDIGNESGSNANDLVGFKRSYLFPGDSEPTLLNLAYQYQTDPEQGWIGVDGNGLPGVIGSVFLESPLATDTVVIWDTIGTEVGPDTVLPGEPLGMTAFKIFTLQIDPKTDPERYTIMSGYDPQSAGGKYNPYMDDVYGPGDKRFIQVSGPFKMAPGKTVRLVAAALVAKDTTNILYAAKKAVEIYKNGFLAPKSPDKPHLYVWPKDRKVYLYWDNAAELSRDAFYDATHGANPAYREYDFEGYMLLRSIDKENWDTLGIWDKKDGITIVYTDSLYDPEISQYVYTDSLVLGSDAGLAHAYVDEDTILKDGVEYYYQLVAYDFNYGDYMVVGGDTVGINAFSLPTKTSVSVTPHAERADFVAPEIDLNNYMLSSGFKYNGIMVTTKDTSAFKAGTYTLHFTYQSGKDSSDNPTTPNYPNISIYVQNAQGDTVFTPTAFDFTQPSKDLWVGTLPTDLIFNGVLIQNAQLALTVNLDSTYYDIPTELYDKTTTDSTEWRITKLSTNWVPDSDTTMWSALIKDRSAFFPTAYEITWIYQGDSVTLQVYDTVRKINVPYNPNISKENSAYGWAFIQGVTGTPRFGATEWIPKTASAGITGIYGLKLPGSKVFEFTDFGGGASLPQNGTVWHVSTHSAVSYTMFPTEQDSIVLNVSDIKTTKDYTLDSVTVFPNPYYVLTPRDLSKQFRIGGIHFMGLPSRCTIRIYTLSGDLVKTINVTPEDDGQVSWELLSDYGTRPASGMYIYHIETPDGKEKTGKIALIF